MEKRNYDSTVARIAGNIAAGLVTTPHFQHKDGVINHNELVAVAVDLARRIVIVVGALPSLTQETT